MESFRGQRKGEMGKDEIVNPRGQESVAHGLGSVAT